MSETVSWRPKAGEIPTSPGVYRFRDEQGRVLFANDAHAALLGALVAQLAACTPDRPETQFAWGVNDHIGRTAPAASRTWPMLPGAD